MAGQIQKEELKQKKNECYIIDVRERDEPGQIEGAHRIPLGQLIRDSGSLPLPKDREIITYCARGTRGQIAADFLEKKGFKVRNLQGGFADWSA